MIGTTFANRYEILGELGRGGMGIVYRARDPVLDREVAIKVVPPTALNPELEERFQREARLVAQLDHPAIVAVHDFGRFAESLYFVMPLLEGVNLRHLLARGALDRRRLVEIGVAVAEALEYSHRRGVVHRDVKPENVMVAEERDGRLRVRVMDFGVAQSLRDPRVTRTGALLGTLSYASPEQLETRPLDGRSDVFSLGVVLYECLAGAPPFDGILPVLVDQILRRDPPPLARQVADLPAALVSLVHRCLEKDPARRPASAGEVAAALRAIWSELPAGEAGAVPLAAPPRRLRPELAPLVGRGRELGLLEERLAWAAQGTSQLALVAGEAGVGKSRLVEELATRARNGGLRVLRGRCVEPDRAFPYSPFYDLVQDFFRGKEATEASSGLPDLADLLPELAALFPLLGELPDLRSTQATTAAGLLSPAPPRSDEPTRIWDLLARTILRLAGGRPLLIVLEDLHLADVSVEALRYIVPRLGATRTLVVGTYRPEEVDRRHPLTELAATGGGRTPVVALAPFSAEEHRELLASLLGGEPAPELAARLYDATEGRAFFTTELVRSLQESDSLVRTSGGRLDLSAEVGSESERLPATIQEAVERRLERLPEAARDALTLAAVLGRELDFADLEGLAAGESLDVDEAVDALLEAGLLVEERRGKAERLAFASGLVREVAYGALSRRRRRSLHRRAGEHLERRHAERLERVAVDLFHHFFQGEEAEKGVRYGTLAARRALAAWSADDAVRLARSALELVDEEWSGDPAAAPELRTLLARAHRVRGDVPAALELAEAAAGGWEKLGRHRELAELALFAAETAWQGRRSVEARRFVERGLAVAQELPIRRALLALGATLANLRGDAATAQRYLVEEEALARADRREEETPPAPRSGRLVVGLAPPIGLAEPWGLATDDEVEVYATVFETLLASDPNGRPIPALAERWSVEAGGRRLALGLRGGVRFHDGTPLDAAAVQDSFARAIRGGAAQRAPFAPIRGAAAYAEGRATALEGVVVAGERELQIELEAPLPIYPILLTDLSAGISRPAPAPGAPPLGTGPFRLASVEPGRIVLEPHPHREEVPRGGVAAIEMRPGLGIEGCRRGLAAGELDLVRDLPADAVDELRRGPRFRLVEAPRRSLWMALLAGPERVAEPARAVVRRVLTAVVDGRDLVWRTVGRWALPATGLMPPGVLGHDPGRRSRLVEREEAKAALAAAGVSGLVLRAAVHPIFRDRYPRLLAALVAGWRELGIEVEAPPLTLEEYLAAARERQGLDLLLGRWIASYADPDSFATLFHSRQGLFRSWVAGPAIDELVERGRSEPEPAARRRVYRALDDLLSEEGSLLPLFHDVDYRLVGPEIEALTVSATPPYVDYTAVRKRSAAREPAAAPAPAGLLRVPLAGVVESLDPSLVSTVEAAELVPTVFETLVRDVDGANVVPWLASSMRIEEGGRRYRFELRRGVRFHDGRALTARDVRASFERLLANPASPARRLFTPIRGAEALLRGESRVLEGIEIFSAHELAIELETPVAFFPALLTHLAAAIVPEGHRPADDAGWVGTGPFQVARFEPRRRLELERNPGYWRPGLPRAGRLVFELGVAPEEIRAGFAAGRFQVAADLYPTDVAELLREGELAGGFREVPRLSTYMLVFNRHAAALADPARRRAVARAVPVEALVSRALGRLASPARSLIPPGLLGHLPAAPRGGGEPLSERLRLRGVLHPVFFGEYAAYAEALLHALAEQGIDVEVVNRDDPRGWLEQTRPSPAAGDFFLARWVADYPDADTFVRGYLHSREGSMGPYVADPEIDALAERGRLETDPTLRQSLYQQAEERIAREALLVPLFHEQVYRFARPELSGFEVTFSKPVVPYEKLAVRG